ncbi:MAG TPA: dihydroorotate dehydrogenase-like protein [Candidatus Limnocylindrales bacterium]|nr:dihydroorotate dehydrogenase-like protein [Candidatus Limnocylindrales bacterium]
MVDITTTYLNLPLRSPVVASASPLWDNLDNIKRAEDAGVGAVVLFSLFEEQIRQEREAMLHYLEINANSNPEALTYIPEPEEFHARPNEYLDLIRKAKEAVDIPIIASINGASLGGWTTFARQMEQAGADAIELNIYAIPTETDKTGTEVESVEVDIVRAVKNSLTVPVAVKLSPYYSNFAHMAKQMEGAGADALVLFNRFYQPDIDLETLEIKPNVLLSTSQNLRLPLTWIGILYGKLALDLAGTSGVHTPADVLKMLMVGANAVMTTAALLKHGIGYAAELVDGMTAWLEEHEYESVNQMRGSLSMMHAEDPTAFERAQYMRALNTYRPNTLRA